MATTPALSPAFQGNLFPTHTFQINLPTLQRYSWSLPNRTTLDGNETVTEESNLPNTRSTWIPGLIPGGAGNIAQMIVGNNSSVPPGSVTPQNGATFTVSGAKAIYLKKTYCSTPPNPLTDMLILVS